MSDDTLLVLLARMTERVLERRRHPAARSDLIHRSNT